MDLQKAISAIFDFTYASTKVKVPSVSCVEIGKILHTGLYIEEVWKRTPAFAFSDSQRAQLNGPENKFSRQVASDVENSYAEMNDKWRIYSDDIAFEAHEIGFIVARLDGLVFSDAKRDVFGDALEVFRSKWAKREGGQFFTDQMVTHLAVKAVSFDPLAGDDLVDICAGTGGFLSAGLHHLKNEISERGVGNGAEAKLSEISAKKLIGQEIDETVARWETPP